MKKLIILAVFTAFTALAFAGNSTTRLWAPRAVDKLLASNASPQDYSNYIGNFGQLPTGTESITYRHDAKGNSVPPVPFTAVQKTAEKGWLYNIHALASLLNSINMPNNYYLTDKQQIMIDANNPEHRKSILWLLSSSGLVFEAELPADVIFESHGNLVSVPSYETVGIGSVKRSAHMLRDGRERALWLRLPNGGAVPLVSLYCFNVIKGFVSQVPATMPTNPAPAPNPGSGQGNYDRGNYQQGQGQNQGSDCCGNFKAPVTIPVASIPVSAMQMHVPQGNTMMVSPVQVQPMMIGGGMTVLPSANINVPQINTNRTPVYVNGNSTNVGFNGVNTTTGNGQAVNVGFGNNINTSSGMGTNVQQAVGQAQNGGF